MQSVHKIHHLDEQSLPTAVNSNKCRQSFERFIYHQHLRYLYDRKRGLFVLLRGLERDFSCQELHKMCHGLTTAQQKSRLARHGPNSMEVPVTPYHILLIEEVLHPFFIFEVHCVCATRDCNVSIMFAAVGKSGVNVMRMGWVPLLAASLLYGCQCMFLC